MMSSSHWWYSHGWGSWSPDKKWPCLVLRTDSEPSSDYRGSPATVCPSDFTIEIITRIHMYKESGTILGSSYVIPTKSCKKVEARGKLAVQFNTP